MVLRAFYAIHPLQWMESATPKIQSRKVLMIGRESRHSLAVTIPAKICKALKIEKGTVLYFKLEENHLVVSKEKPFQTDAADVIKLQESKKVEDVKLEGISLSDLHY